ncbi:MAG: hypothetical protein IT371_20155 [Deltaproteobacteria bacterium]|nr:hypothetical protein [Deltaproteobacteria bacterium]
MTGYTYDERRDGEDEGAFLQHIEAPVPLVPPVSWWDEVSAVTGSTARIVLEERYRLAERRIVAMIEAGEFWLSPLLAAKDPGASFAIRGCLFGEKLASSGNSKEAPRHRAIQAARAVLALHGCTEFKLPLLSDGSDGPALFKNLAESDAQRVGHRVFVLSATSEVPLALAAKVLTISGLGVRAAKNAGVSSRYHKVKELTPAEAAKWRESQTAAPTKKGAR